MVISRSISKPNNKFAKKFTEESWKTEVRSPKTEVEVASSQKPEAKNQNYET